MSKQPLLDRHDSEATAAAAAAAAADAAAALESPAAAHGNDDEPLGSYDVIDLPLPVRCAGAAVLLRSPLTKLRQVFSSASARRQQTRKAATACSHRSVHSPPAGGGGGWARARCGWGCRCCWASRWACYCPPQSRCRRRCVASPASSAGPTSAPGARRSLLLRYLLAVQRGGGSDGFVTAGGEGSSQQGVHLLAALPQPRPCSRHRRRHCVPPPAAGPSPSTHSSSRTTAASRWRGSASISSCSTCWGSGEEEPGGGT